MANHLVPDVSITAAKILVLIAEVGIVRGGGIKSGGNVKSIERFQQGALAVAVERNSG